MLGLLGLIAVVVAVGIFVVIFDRLAGGHRSSDSSGPGGWDQTQ